MDKPLQICEKLSQSALKRLGLGNYWVEYSTFYASFCVNMVAIKLPEHEPPTHVPCQTLKRFRLSSGLSQPKLAAMCHLALLGLDSPLREEKASPEELILTLSCMPGRGLGLDSTHLSKFECGHQPPWPLARLCLCMVFSIVNQRYVSEAELFPEIANTSSNSSNYDEILLQCRTTPQNPSFMEHHLVLDPLRAKRRRRLRNAIKASIPA